MAELHKSVCTTDQNYKPLKLKESRFDFENFLT